MKKIFFVFLILLSAKSFGQNINVEGLLDCGKWLDARKQGSASALEHYAIGTVNGLSLGSGYEIWMGDGNRTTRSQLFYWLDAHCTKNPLDNVVSALMQFADQKTIGAWRGEKKKK
jgi:hypothetical protein